MSDGLPISPCRLWNSNPLRKNEERAYESPLCHYHVKLRHGCIFAVICHNSLISELMKLSNMKKRLISSKHINTNPGNYMVAEEEKRKGRCNTEENCNCSVQGGASGQTLGFADLDFQSSDVLSRCCANSARFAAAQPESGRERKQPNQSQLNIGSDLMHHAVLKRGFGARAFVI